MDRARKRSDSGDAADSCQFPADKRPCSSSDFRPSPPDESPLPTTTNPQPAEAPEPSEPAPATATPTAEAPAAPEQDATAASAASEMDTSSSERGGGGGESPYNSCDSDDSSGGSAHGRFRRIVAALKEETGESAKLTALTELCEALAFCTEDVGESFPTDLTVVALVRLAGADDGNPDVMLLAVRAITYLVDLIPRANNALVRHGALPVLCNLLLNIVFVDVAEQALQALEKISQKQPLACLQAGMITAVLRYIGFFSTSSQRIAVSAVANVCKNAPMDQSSLLMESAPTLCDLLLCEDKKLVETTVTCFVTIIDSFGSSTELLDMLFQHGLLKNLLNLINIDGRSSLSQTTYISLIGLVTKLASVSLVAVKSLFELNVSKVVRNILVTSDLSHGLTYVSIGGMQLSQVHEALKLVNQLIPSAAKDGDDVQAVLAKENILRDQPHYLCQFSQDILPVLIKAVNSGANIYICYGSATVVYNILSLCKPEMLTELLRETNISSYLAGLLARKDHHVLFLSLKIAEILMQKLPDVFLNSLIKEGVVYAVEALLSVDLTTNSGDAVQKSDNPTIPNDATRCLCYTFDYSKSGSSDGRVCLIKKENLFNFARRIKTTYFTHEAISSEMGITEILQKLRTCCAILNEPTDVSSNQDSFLEHEEYLTNILKDIMMEFRGGDTMTTFEFLESGLVRSLASYLTKGRYLQETPPPDCSSGYIQSVLIRFKSFARICFSKMDQGWENMLLTQLVRKLQQALTAVDNFPVVMSHAFRPRNSTSDIPTKHSSAIPCLKISFKREENEVKLADYGSTLSVGISSSLDDIEEFLWSKIMQSAENQEAESSVRNSDSDARCADEVNEEIDGKLEPSNCGSSEVPKGGEHVGVSGEAQVGSAMVSRKQHVSTKLIFSLKGEKLDRSLTPYEAILNDQLTSGPDVVIGSDFWNDEYEIRYRSARNAGPGELSTSYSGLHSFSFSDEASFSWAKFPFFSCLLSAKLPCGLDRSSPSYDILFILKILEGISRSSSFLLSDEREHAFAEETNAAFYDLKESFSVPGQEFVSPKLTDKLEQQMQDPVVSSSGSMPAWCKQLMDSCPFLFSLEARWKYFRLTTFGSLPVQHNHLLQPEGSENSSSSSERRPATREKFKVSRRNILASAAKMMKSHAKSKMPLEVEYDEEVGTGLGPTMEFYTLIGHEFQKVGLGMWREDHCRVKGTRVADYTKFVEAPCGFFPRPWSANVPDVLKRFFLLGQIVAKAIKECRILDIPFSKAFYKLILDQELTIYDILSIDPELGRRLLEFQALVSRRRYFESNMEKCEINTDLCYRGTKVEDLCIDFMIPGYPDYLVSSASNSKTVTIDNLEEYIALVVDATTRSGVISQVESFKSGFNEIFPLKALRVFSEHELEKFICGEHDNWDFADLVDHIKFDHGYTASSKPVINLLEIIREFGSDERRAFLQFVTGAPRLPPGGFAALHPKLTVVRKQSGNATDDLPSVMTCANYLKLPAYSSKERMKERLLYAITEGQGSFHLS